MSSESDPRYRVVPSTRGEALGWAMGAGGYPWSGILSKAPFHFHHSEIVDWLELTGGPAPAFIFNLRRGKLTGMLRTARLPEGFDPAEASELKRTIENKKYVRQTLIRAFLRSVTTLTILLSVVAYFVVRTHADRAGCTSKGTLLDVALVLNLVPYFAVLFGGGLHFIRAKTLLDRRGVLVEGALLLWITTDILYETGFTRFFALLREFC